ncbi:MAG: SCO family protein [Bacteroidota bacterium]
MKVIFFVFTIVVLFTSCSEKKVKTELPIYGRKKIVEKEVNGEVKNDTLYHTVADFNLVNQDSAVITNSTFNDKIYVADFFFTSCPSICPIMKKQMLRVYSAYEEEDEFSIVSHTIDPEYDTVALLKDYAERLGVSSDKWHFLTGGQDEIYDLGQASYMVTAAEDSDAPGGYIHDGAFLLVDKDRRIRGVYDGTREDQVSILIDDIKVLLNEYEEKSS